MMEADALRCSALAALINLQCHANIAPWSGLPSIIRRNYKSDGLGALALGCCLFAAASLLLRRSVGCYSLVYTDSGPGFLRRTTNPWLLIRCKNSQLPSGRAVAARGC
jgi:hypothetical protein